jgi:hypothetical protein
MMHDWLLYSAVPGVGLAPAAVLQDMLLSFVLAQFVAWLYVWTHRGLSYSRNMVHSIVLLGMIVTMVMLVVGDSIARAFGLVGALAIIRFRTVVRDARDTTFIFLSLAVGIAIGAQHEMVAVTGTLVVTFVAALLQFTGFGTRHADTGTLRVRGTGALTAALDEVLAAWCRTHEMIALREGAGGGESEYAYEIRLYHPSEREDLIQAVRAVAGTTGVTVAIEENAEEW